MTLFISDDLRKYLNIEDVGDNIELEAKIRYDFEDKNIQSFLSLIDRKKYSVEISTTTDYYKDDERFTNDGKEIFLTSKLELKKPKIIFEEKGSIKFTLSSEKKQLSAKPVTYFMEREKKRTSLIRGNISIDITKVIEKKGMFNCNKRKKNEFSTKERWEVEIEVINYQEFNLDEFITSLNFVYQNTVMGIQNVYFFYNSVFGNRDYKYINRKNVSKARDLEIRDLTNNGLLKSYMASPKADGRQGSLYLIFHRTGVWLISLKSYQKIALLQEEYKQYENTIYVGELLEKDEMKKSFSLKEEQLFLVFDTLIYKGQNVHKESYIKRRSFFHQFSISDKLKIEEKEAMEVGNSAEEFYTNIKKIFDMISSTYYKTDGLVFTPINSGYITDGQFIKNNKIRCLSLYDDVCKWKDAKDLTIDFLVKENKLYVSERDTTIPFEGNYKHPFSEENYNIRGQECEGKIVEFYPTFKGEEIIYFPKRIREDKPFANNNYTANNVWNLVHSPVTKETLLGENITLLRKYHNKIKKNIINQISGYVVDIGSGNGGDLFKYNDNYNVKKVLSVEPNQMFIQEFLNRLYKVKNRNKFVSPLQAGGQDSQKIYDYCKEHLPEDMKDQELNISFMLSLSFFWKDKQRLESLIQTIQMIYKAYKEKGGNKNLKIYYLTIVGDKVRDLFRKSENIKLGTIRLKRINNNEYFVDIEDSVTVFSQIEYYVQLKDLIEKLNLSTLSLKTPLGDMPEDYILSKSEKTYTSLFQYGVFESKGDISQVELLATNILAVDNISEEKIPQIDENIYRIKSSTKDSLYYSLLWLLSPIFRRSSAEKQKSKIMIFKTQLSNSKNLNYISRKINHNIIIFDKLKNKEKIETNSKKDYIFLYKIDDNYEPLIYKKDNDMVLTFSNEFFLV